MEYIAKMQNIILSENIWKDISRIRHSLSLRIFPTNSSSSLQHAGTKKVSFNPVIVEKIVYFPSFVTLSAKSVVSKPLLSIIVNQSSLKLNTEIYNLKCSIYVQNNKVVINKIITILLHQRSTSSPDPSTLEYVAFVSLLGAINSEGV